jgi:hypothetical protein
MAITEKGKIVNSLMKELSNKKLVLVSSAYRIMIGKCSLTVQGIVAILKTKAVQYWCENPKSRKLTIY